MLKGNPNGGLEFSIEVHVRGLSAPPRKQRGKRVSLAKFVKRNIIAFETGTDLQRSRANRKRKAKEDDEERLRKRVEANIQEGDFSPCI